MLRHATPRSLPMIAVSGSDIVVVGDGRTSDGLPHERELSRSVRTSPASATRYRILAKPPKDRGCQPRGARDGAQATRRFFSVRLRRPDAGAQPGGRAGERAPSG